MTRQDETIGFFAGQTLGGLAKKPSKHANILQNFVQPGYYSPEQEPGFGRTVYSTLLEPEPKPSWALLEGASFVVENITAPDIGDLLRERLQQAFGYSKGFGEIRSELAELKLLLASVSAKVDGLKTELSTAVCVPIRSFTPEPFEVIVPIDIVISAEEDGFQASFLDANLHAYGESREEALFNIKVTILDAYRRLRELSDDQLGQSMLRQKQVLRHQVREVHAG